MLRGICERGAEKGGLAGAFGALSTHPNLHPSSLDPERSAGMGSNQRYYDSKRLVRDVVHWSNEYPSSGTGGALKDAPVQSLTMKQTMQAVAIKGSH